MGFPATGIEHLYRNPRSEIARFLNQHHSGRYKVYNLCCEPGRGYPAAIFDGRVERFPFRDHCVPTLEAMYACTNSAKRWLDEHPDNVVALHCKAGKGRAGVMTCLVLLRIGAFSTADDCMDYYDQTRVTNRKGLTVRNQRKYVNLYERLWREHWGVSGSLRDVPAEDEPLTVRQLPVQPERTIVAVRLIDPGERVTVDRSFVCKVMQGTSFSPEVVSQCRLSTADRSTVDPDVHEWRPRATVRGNFSIVIKTTVRCGTKPFKFCDMWENTAFLDEHSTAVSYGFDQLDFKKRIRRVVSQDVKLEVFFEDATAPEGLPKAGQGTAGHERASSVPAGVPGAFEMADLAVAGAASQTL